MKRRGVLQGIGALAGLNALGTEAVEFDEVHVGEYVIRQDGTTSPPRLEIQHKPTGTTVFADGQRSGLIPADTQNSGSDDSGSTGGGDSGGSTSPNYADHVSATVRSYITSEEYFESARDLDVQSDYTYLTGRWANAFNVVDIHDKNNPEIVGTTTVPDPQGVKVQGDRAVVIGADSSTLAMVDVSDPTNPTVLGTIQDDRMYEGISVDYLRGSTKEYALVAAWRGGFSAVDVTEPTNMDIVGHLPIADYPEMDGAQGVETRNGLAYVASTNYSGMGVVDVSNPANLELVGSVSNQLMPKPQDVDFRGDHAYVGSNRGNSVTSVDISSPTDPAVVDSYSASEFSGHTVEIQGPYCYCASAKGDGMIILDISDPTNIQEVAAVRNQNELAGAAGIAVQDNYAFVASEFSHSFVIIG